MKAGLQAVLMLLLMFSIGRSADAQTPRSITLDQAVQRGIEQAPRLAEARAREAAAETTIVSRQALGRPSVVASAAYLRTNHVEEFGVPQAGGGVRILFPDIPSNYRLRTELAVPVFTAGRVDGLVEAARADVRAAGAERRAAEEDVRLDVSRAYFDLVTAREAVRVMVQALERADAWVGDVKARVDAGLLPPNDLLSGQAQRARQSVHLIQARNEAAIAEMTLARLIGEAPGQPIVTLTTANEPLAGSAEVVAQSASALIARAAERRAERAGLLERQASLRAAASAALAGRRPQVSAVAAIEPARPNQRFVPRMDEWRTSWDVGVHLTWSLFDGGRARADRAAVLAQADAVGHRLEDFDASVAVEIRRHLLDLESARAALAASAEAVAAAAEARRVVDERFRAGVAMGTDVLDAQGALLEAELERTRLSAALRVGEARLIRAAGGR